MPETGGDFVGPGGKAPAGSDPATDGYNGEFPMGTRGFISFLRASWAAALEEASNICDDEAKCCKSVQVKTQCNSKDAIRIMKKHNLHSWCTKSTAVPCG